MQVVLALLMGIVAGLRAMTAPAVASWAGYVGRLSLASTPLAFMGSWWVPWLFTALALGELVTDQLPSTPSRKVPMQLGARVVTGALAGATIAATGAGLAGRRRRGGRRLHWYVWRRRLPCPTCRFLWRRSSRRVY